MRWHRRVVTAALVVLPAVDAFCASAARHTTTYKTPAWAVGGCCSNRGRTRGPCELSTSRRVAVTMQGGAGYGGGGDGKFLPLEKTVRHPWSKHTCSVLASRALMPLCSLTSWTGNPQLYCTYCSTFAARSSGVACTLVFPCNLLEKQGFCGRIERINSRQQTRLIHMGRTNNQQRC